MSAPERAEAGEQEAAGGKPFTFEPLSVAIRRFSVFDSDDDDDHASDHEDSSSAPESSDHKHSESADTSTSSSRTSSSAASSIAESEDKDDDHTRQGPRADSPPPPPPPPPAASVPRVDPVGVAKASDHHQADHTPAVSPAPATQQRAAPPSVGVAQEPPAPAQSVSPSQPKHVSHPSARRKRGQSGGGRKTIYERGMMQQRATDQRIEEMRAALAAREVEGATFQPTISTRARRLCRSPDAVLRQQRDEEVLRKRLQVLEAPMEDDAAEFTFVPQISARSERIVRACRTGNPSSGCLPAAERLYLDHVYREQAPPPPDSAAVAAVPDRARRSRSEIAAHVATLYAFEQRKQEAVCAIRESGRAGPAHTLYVDPAEVVARLTQPRPTSRTEGAGALVHVTPAAGDSAAPAASVNPEMASLARSRGLLRWFAYFANCEPTLATHRLLEYEGHHAAVARTVSGVLLRADVECCEWTPEAFLAAMDDALCAPHGPELLFWRTRPVTATPQERELTFRPQLNPTSERLLASAAVSAERRGATHDRLFMEARLQQLQAQQAELEAQRQQLAEAEKENRRRTDREQRWRQQSRDVLHAAAADPVEDDTHRQPSIAPPPPPPRPRSARVARKKSGVAAAPAKKPAAPNVAPATTLVTAALQTAFRELQSTLDGCDASTARLVPTDAESGEAGGEDSDRSRTPLSIHSEHEEEAESNHTDTTAGTGRRPLAAHPNSARHNLDFLLACADCRQPSTVRSSERQLLEQENRQRLRRLGMQLYYDQQWS